MDYLQKTPSCQTFGGLVYLSDFNTESCFPKKGGSSVAGRILSDWRFDEICRKNLEMREKTR